MPNSSTTNTAFRNDPGRLRQLIQAPTAVSPHLSRFAPSAASLFDNGKTMTIPDYQSLMLPVLISSSKGEIRIGPAIEELADQLGLSPQERSELLPSGKQTLFANRVHWAKTYLAQAGLVENTRRGHFKITQRGQQALAGRPSRIDNAFLSQFEEFQQFKKRARASQTEIPEAQSDAEERAFTSETETPDEIMRRAHKQIDAALAQDLLDRIRAAPPEFFERLVVNLLLSMGYGGSNTEKAGRTLGRSGDDGVDGVIDQDALGLDRVYIQAKRYAAGNSIGSGAIRDFFGTSQGHEGFVCHDFDLFNFCKGNR